MSARIGLLWLAVAGLPSVAKACPVCFAARDEAERLALLGTTVFLTSLPVIMIGGIIYWVARRSGELDAELPEAVREPDEARPVSGEHEVVPLHRSGN